MVKLARTGRVQHLQHLVRDDRLLRQRLRQNSDLVTIGDAALKLGGNVLRELLDLFDSASQQLVVVERLVRPSIEDMCVAKKRLAHAEALLLLHNLLRAIASRSVEQAISRVLLE